MKKILLRLTFGILAIAFNISAFAQVYTFTNCNATGRFGPTQAQVNAAYSATTLDGVVTITTQGIQEWTVPASGAYTIQVSGAEGGLQNTAAPGKGAIMTGDVTLTVGEVLLILVGQQGSTINNGGSGGGGASFVVRASGNTPLVVAGGGMGGNNHTAGGYTISEGGSITNTGIGGGAQGYSSSVSGGGGFSGNGLGNAGGLSFLNGGTGGAGNGAGGFGGGGGKNGSTLNGACGGGGYSGGAGNNNIGNYSGGGSFNSGINQSNTAGNNTGMGGVIITSLCNPTVVPTVVCPANDTVNIIAGTCGALVTYTLPTATDDCGNLIATQTAGIASGSIFPVGITTNTYRAINAIDTVFCSFRITVNDTEAPTIVCPANITVNNDAGQCGAIVNYALPVGVDSCSAVTVALTSGLASGAVFPAGITTVTYTATDAWGNTSTPCSFTVTVIDTIAPSITCLADVFSCDTIVNGIAPVATSDNCIGEYVTFTLSGATTGTGLTDASGAAFNVGTTTVWYHVTDSAGNTDSCTFNVEVGGQISAIIMNPFNVDTVCHGTNSIALPAVSPSGGTFTGLGVVGLTFDPSIAGVGTHFVYYSVAAGNSCTSIDSAMIVVVVCVGINENRLLNNVNIYPNPTNGLVHVNLGNHNGSINYRISTIEGRIVKQEQNVSSNKMTIDLSEESKGIYLLRIEDETSSKVYKVIRE